MTREPWSPPWRGLLVDGPTRIIDHLGSALAWSGDRLDSLEGWVGQCLAPLWRACWMLSAALAIICLTTTVLALIATLLRIPMPLPPPVPLPLLPGASRTGA